MIPLGPERQVASSPPIGPVPARRGREKRGTYSRRQARRPKQGAVPRPLPANRRDKTLDRRATDPGALLPPCSRAGVFPFLSNRQHNERYHRPRYAIGD